MRTVQGSMLLTLRAIETFMDTNASALGSVPGSGARKRLDTLVNDLQTLVENQSGSRIAAMGATQKHYTLRQALIRDHMAPIAKIAAAELPPTPELDPLKKLPRGRTTAERLKGMADGMANAAGPYKDIFVSAGMPDDFIQRLRTAADAMVTSVAQRRRNRAERTEATAGLRNMLSAGRKLVHILDAMIRSAAKDNSALLEAWDRIKRVEKVPGGARATVPAASAPTQPATSSTPAASGGAA